MELAKNLRGAINTLASGGSRFASRCSKNDSRVRLSGSRSCFKNIRLDHKEKLPTDAADFKNTVAKELSAFAETYGGYLIVSTVTSTFSALRTGSETGRI